MFVPQHGVAILETEIELTDKQADKLKASLRLLGVEAEILPKGVTLAHFAMQDMCDDEDED